MANLLAPKGYHFGWKHGGGIHTCFDLDTLTVDLVIFKNDNEKSNSSATEYAYIKKIPEGSGEMVS